MRYMIISASGGVIGEAFTCEKLELAIAKGKALWKEATGYETMHEYRGTSVLEVNQEEWSYDEKAGGVSSRSYEMHWWNDDKDVWVIQPEVIT